MILPRVADLTNDPTILHLIEASYPHGILPFHERLAERELAQVLKRPPDDLSASVTDYLAWRGIRIDRDTVHLIRRTIDKSADLRSISALARSMYVSRRALGRPTSRSSPTRQSRPRCSRDSTGSSVPTPTAVRRFPHCISPTPHGSRAAGTRISGRRRTTSRRRSGASFPRPAHAGRQLLRGPVDTSAQSISIFLPLPVTGCGAFPA